VLAAPAEIGDTDFERLHGHGYGDEQIAEVVGLVSLQLLTGAFNLVAGHPAQPSRYGPPYLRPGGAPVEPTRGGSDNPAR
jgi:hypothetical protein